MVKKRRTSKNIWKRFFLNTILRFSLSFQIYTSKRSCFQNLCTLLCKGWLVQQSGLHNIMKDYLLLSIHIFVIYLFKTFPCIILHSTAPVQYSACFVLVWLLAVLRGIRNVFFRIRILSFNQVIQDPNWKLGQYVKRLPQDIF